MVAFDHTASAEAAAAFPILKGPYLGQKPPGMIPEIFAPGFISTEFPMICSLTVLIFIMIAEQKSVIFIMGKEIEWFGIWLKWID
jgi:hypothetical protein